MASKYITRGDVWNAYVIKEIGIKDSELSSIQHGKRPYVVCQAKKGCASPVLTCAPISTAERRDYPFNQKITLDEDSIIHYEQLIQIPRANFISKIATLNKEQMMEMDMRLSVPIDLCSSSILHIQRIVVDEVLTEDNMLVYLGRMVLKYYVVKFKFSEVDIVTKMGISPESLRKVTKPQFSDLLSTLKGLKFVYEYRCV